MTYDPVDSNADGTVDADIDNTNTTTDTLSTGRINDRSGRQQTRWVEDDNSPVTLADPTDFSPAKDWDEIKFDIRHWKVSTDNRTQFEMRVRFEGDSSFYSGSDYQWYKDNGNTQDATKIEIQNQNVFGGIVSGEILVDLRSDGNQYFFGAPTPVVRTDRAGQSFLGGSVSVDSKGRIAEVRFFSPDTSLGSTGDVLVYGRDRI